MLKRVQNRDASDGRDAKRVRHEYTMCFFVNPRTVNMVIGSKGVLIAELQRETGTMISFEKRDDAGIGHGSGETLRRCTVEGPTPSNIFDAQKAIWAKDDSFTAARLSIPERIVALIIGRAGSQIKEIQDATGAELSFAKPGEMGTLSGIQRMLTIQGNAESIVVASKMVLDILKAHEGELSKSNGDAPRRVSPKPQAPHLSTTELTDYGAFGQVPLTHVTVTLVILPELVSLAVGKQGATVRTMQERAQCKISFSKADENICGTMMRRVEITGGFPQLHDALRHLARISNQNNEDKEKIELHAIFPDNSVALIIGGKGENIRNISTTTGAYLSFAKSEEMGQLQRTERALQLTGAMNSVLDALEMAVKIDYEARGKSGGGRPTGGITERIDYASISGTNGAKVKQEEAAILPPPRRSAADPACNVSMMLPAELREHISPDNLYNSYQVESHINDKEPYVVVEINGENATTAQQDLQLLVSQSIPTVRWQVKAIW